VNIAIDRHVGVQRLDNIKQYRQYSRCVRHLRLTIRHLRIHGAHYGRCRSQWVAKGGHIARHGAIAK